MGEPLHVRDLEVTINGRGVFEAESFDVSPGSILAVTGPSGAGKSTLLKAIAQLIPCSGRVDLGGRTAVELGWPRFRRRVLYVHQQPTFVPGTALENLQTVFRYAARSGDFDETRAVAQLARFGLDRSLLGRNVQQVSVGEGQRLALARALLVEPEVLLLDEPTSALDAESRTRVEETLRQFTAHGHSVVLVTHDDAQAARLTPTLRRLRPREPRKA